MQTKKCAANTVFCWTLSFWGGLDSVHHLLNKQKKAQQLNSFEKLLNNHLTFLEKCFLNLTKIKKEIKLLPQMIL